MYTHRSDRETPNPEEPRNRKGPEARRLPTAKGLIFHKIMNSHFPHHFIVFFCFS